MNQPMQPGMQQPGFQMDFGTQQPGIQQPGFQQPGMQPGMDAGMQQPGSPGMMQPGMDAGMPTAPPVAAPQMHVMGQAMGLSVPGAPPGGKMIHEKYHGPITWASAGVVCILTCCG